MVLSLRLRLVLSFGIPLACSLLFGCMLTGWHAMRSVRVELVAALDVGRQGVDNAMQELPSADDQRRELLRLVQTFDGNRHVIASLLGPDGAPLARSRLSSPPGDVPGWFRRLISPHLAALTIPVQARDVQGLEIRLQANPANEIGEVWGDFRDAILALTVFCLLALGFISWTVRRLLRPVSGLLSGLSWIGSGNYEARVAEDGPAEFAALAGGFNRMAAQLQAIEAQNLRLHEQLAKLQEEERADLARDLHDEVGPSLFAVAIAAATIAELAKAGRSEAILEHAATVRDLVARAQRHIRDILGRLRPIRAIERGLGPAIEGLVAFWRGHCPQIAFAVDLAVDEAALAEQVKEAIYRISQEALSNAVRHGRPSRVEIAVGSDAGELRLQVSDNGTGAPAGAGAGFGLTGIRERVAALAGTLAIQSPKSGAGWKIVVRLPLGAEAHPLATVP